MRAARDSGLEHVASAFRRKDSLSAQAVIGPAGAVLSHPVLTHRAQVGRFFRIPPTQGPANDRDQHDEGRDSEHDTDGHSFRHRDTCRVNLYVLFSTLPLFGGAAVQPEPLRNS